MKRFDEITGISSPQNQLSPENGPESEVIPSFRKAALDMLVELGLSLQEAGHLASPECAEQARQFVGEGTVGGVRASALREAAQKNRAALNLALLALGGG